jgi:phage shock protein PspC (stress-responsive transcriptional regulator)
VAPERNYLSERSGSGVKPRLWRSPNKVFAGVVGGLAERLTVSPTALRWFTAILTVFTGFFPLIVAYLCLWGITGVRESQPEEYGR